MPRPPGQAALWALALICAVGCRQPASHRCALGGICPEELRCVTADGVDLCVLPTCGDGQVDPGESCDDGNNLSGDRCPANCATTCGDGRVEGDEVCDDGNTTAGDGCSADCRSIEVCGNNVVDPSEACDDGGTESHDGCSARCTAEVPSWIALDTTPEPRAGHAAAYDSARGTVVVFGGRGALGLLGDTWTWDGTVWRRLDPAVVPPARADHAMAYDDARQRAVLFGGAGRAEHSTWEWDGVHWIEHQPLSAPPSQLIGSAMAYDAARRRIVLFGGMLDGVAQRATWEWDGDTWHEIMTAGPPARAGHAMAYDSRRRRIVLFGGLGDGGRLGDTWEFDGARWIPCTVVTAPAARAYAALTFDASSGEIALFGGDGDAGLLDDTWTWDGAQWQEATVSAAPRARSAAAMVHDVRRHQIVLFGGEQLLDPRVASAGLSSETWIWSGAAWSSRTLHASLPEPRELGGLVYEPLRGRVVLFGGRGTGLKPNHPPGVYRETALDDTWEWDGATWIPYVSPIAPSPRQGFAIASDAERIVLFGGLEAVEGSFTEMNDTWMLVDTQWRRQTPTAAPSPRFNAAMAYDPVRRKVVLFGGHSSRNDLAETWEWDGVGWVQRLPAHAPSPRSFPAMAFDAVHGRVLVFGGSATVDRVLVHYDDTWEWDGDDWIQLPTTNAPEPGGGHAIASDPVHGTILVFDGTEPAADDSDARTWAWDGSDWQLCATEAPGQRQSVMMAYDMRRDRMVMFGGVSSASGGTTMVSEWDGTRWYDVAPVTHLPPERSLPAMVYDSEDASVVMVGGSVGVNLNNPPQQGMDDTWTWDGAMWREAHPASPPAANFGPALAFDTQRHRAVLFGGAGSADTWEWDGATWLARPGDPGPPTRLDATLVYDAARKQTLLIGGGIGSAEVPQFLDHWAWDGGQWTQIAPRLPFALINPAATYDAARERVVLFGGLRGGYPVDELWEWNGSQWIKHPSTGAWPPARSGHTLVYDPVRRRSVLFGGRNADLFVLNDLWEWDGASWTQITAASPPPPRMYHAMAYDEARRQLVVIGGNDSWKELRDVWLLRYDDPAAPDDVHQSSASTSRAPR